MSNKKIFCPLESELYFQKYKSCDRMYKKINSFEVMLENNVLVARLRMIWAEGDHLF